MPHSRDRFIAKIVLNRLKYSPILLINGARQTGKSFFVRELLSNFIKNMTYVTLDNKQKRDLAISNPWSLISQKHELAPLAIDEAQRSPDLFEAVKEKVDLDKRPAQFILLGSTEFSHRTNIRESLTGRASRLQLFPLLLAEIKGLPLQKPLQKVLDLKLRITRNELMTYLERGGMPGIFAVRDDSERFNRFEDWVDLTVRRDIFQIKGFRSDASLARRILEFIAVNKENSIRAISKALTADRRKVTKHIEALKALFVIESCSVFPGSAGEEIYHLCDVGVAKHLGAPLEQRLRTWIALELRAQAAYRGDRLTKLSTYQTTHGSRIDFILESEDTLFAIKVLPYESYSYQDFEILRAFKVKHQKSKCIALASRAEQTSENIVQVFPWESIG